MTTRIPKRHSHCSWCGQAYPASALWPRACAGCGTTSWLNPTPVAVALQPITMRGRFMGLIGIERGIEPKKGGVAFPAGFMETKDLAWQTALVRELREETGISRQAEDVKLYDVFTTPRGDSLLVFGELPPMEADYLPEFMPNAEVTNRFILTGYELALAFPIHDDVYRRYLKQHLRR